MVGEHVDQFRRNGRSGWAKAKKEFVTPLCCVESAEDISAG